MSATDEGLLIAVLKQVGDVKLNFDLLAEDIGAPTKGAAAKRWSRFQAKLKAGMNGNGVPTNVDPAKPTGVTKNKTNTPKATATKKTPAAKSKKSAVQAEVGDEDEVRGEQCDSEPATPVMKKRKKAAPKAKGAAGGKSTGKGFESEEQIVNEESEFLQIESDNEEMFNGGPFKPVPAAFAPPARDEDEAGGNYYVSEEEET